MARVGAPAVEVGKGAELGFCLKRIRQCRSIGCVSGSEQKESANLRCLVRVSRGAVVSFTGKGEELVGGGNKALSFGCLKVFTNSHVVKQEVQG